ncbi:MAG TPA: amino acid adenylation domain-containing protein [Thermoanaerobaculia bacterium]|nr:amino acid adenylation domain-containing protein [Thermoanaerobaculia bacterium]
MLLAALHDYWLAQLSAEGLATRVPLDEPREPAIGPAWRTLPLPGLADRADSWALLRDRRAFDAFVPLAAGAALCMATYSRSELVTVGSPAHGADPHAHGRAVPLVIRCTATTTARELLAEVHATALSAFARQRVPFAALCELRGSRAADECPLFDIAVRVPGLHHAMPRVGHTLTIEWTGAPEGAGGAVQYDAARIEAAAALGFSAHVAAAAAALVQSPDASIGEIALLGAGERHPQMDQWSAGPCAEVGETTPLWELFSRQAQEAPRAVALRQEGQSVSYAELERRASALARRLAAAGVRPGTRVAFCLRPSTDAVATVLASLRLGATYVPLAPDWPAARLERTLADVAAPVLIVDEGTPRLRGFSGAMLLLQPALAVTDHDESDLGAIDAAPASDPEHVIAILHTSSSSGRPKGTLIPQRAVLNRLSWMWSAFPFEAGEVMALQKSLALVGAFWECLGGLLRGVPTVVLSEGDVRDPARLWTVLREEQVTRLSGSPALLAGLLDQAEREPAASTALLLVGTSAEAIPPWLVERWRDRFPDVTLLNLYGATECSSHALAYDVAGMPTTWRRVPVGKPIAGCRAYVLDDRLRPVPIGALGELCIAGACVARGYLDLPDLTHEHFVPDPYHRGGSLYRTGDLARFRHDGTVELLGRLDDQVKLRGFRIDLGEVEAVLGQHPDVIECSVSLLEDTWERRRLVAHAVGRNGVAAATLRTYLRAQLPEPMVPAEIVLLDILPRLLSGKLDRRRLVALTAARAEPRACGPRHGPAEVVCALLEEILAVPSIDPDEHFLDLQLHSLLMIELRNRLQHHFGRDVPTLALFENPTARKLAAFLGTAPAPAAGLAGIQMRARRQQAAALAQRLAGRRARRMDEA